VTLCSKTKYTTFFWTRCRYYTQN